MDCYNCGKLIADNNNCSEDGFVFCDPICRYDWRKKGKPIRQSDAERRTNPFILKEQDMTFNVPITGFDRRNLCVRVSYWIGTRLYLDGKKVNPVEKKPFSRKYSYSVKDNIGNPINIDLQYKGFDIIPVIVVNSIKYHLAKPLSAWEYIWISIPFILLFIGGALGGVLGGAAVFFNAILIRKIRHWIPRYLITGCTTLLAFVFFWKAALFLMPSLEYLSLKSSYSHPNSRTLDILTSRVWTCKKVLDLQGNNIISSSNPILGSKRYFKGNGNFSQVFSNGSKLSGVWEFDSLNNVLNVKFDTLRTSVNIIEITPAILRLKYENTLIVHESD